MSPCSPSDVHLNIPDGPSGPILPGFGNPFTLKLPGIDFPDGFPEDLLSILDQLQFLIPPGILKPALNLNFSKDIFDAIMKLLDQFLPFLMLYKFFLPLLNLIICIIEVLCAIPNPFKLIRAMRRLFRNCIPPFLNLFPLFALIIMIISLLLLLLALIEYIIAQILKIIEDIIKNIQALTKAFQQANATSILAIAKKIGALLCVFQNLFVLLSLFNIIIQVIKDMLGQVFAIPPCDDSGSGDADGCCTPDVCPAIVKSNYTRTTGSFQYLRKIGIQTSIVFPGNLGNFNVDVRNESWSIYDPQQEIAQQFINIVDGYDITTIPKPVFFPTDSTYNSATDPRQAAYTVDLRLFYNPQNWGRAGAARNIRFKNCIVINAPTRTLNIVDGTTQTINNGVMLLAGGLGYEDDGITILNGFGSDGITQISNQATLENFIHEPDRFTSDAVVFTNSDGYTFQNIEYTFTPHIDTLLNKQLITLGCDPSFSLNRAFINTAFAGDVGLKTQLLKNLINGAGFPDPDAAQQCLQTALSALRGNLTLDGVAQFQATTTICLNKLKSDTNNALGDLIGIGTEPCNSDFSLSPPIQFTSKPIVLKVNLKERNGISLTNNLPVDVANSLASKIKPHQTFGEVGPFSYDGYQFFTANLTSKDPGQGQVMVSFDNNIFCTNTIPADNTVDPSHDLKVLKYQFIYTPSGPSSPTSDGQVRRDEGDLARDSTFGEGKDGS